MKNKILSIVLCITMLFGLSACGKVDSSDNESIMLNVAYQYGLAYAPLIICKQQGLIEKAYEEATGKKVEITWTQMSSGADINTGIISGDIQAGFMGIAPAISGMAAGVDYRIFTNLSGQEHGLMTNDKDINKLGDLVGSNKQIALVNIGSIQHIILAKALVENGYDAHALDSNIIGMKHPDGMSSLLTDSVSCHLTTNPYIYEEREQENLKELTEVSEIWTVENSFIVGVAANNLYEENLELYTALYSAISESIDFVNNNMEETAEITCEFNGNSKEDELKYLSVGKYSEETKGVFELARFMSENGFIESEFNDYKELTFENVKGN